MDPGSSPDRHGFLHTPDCNVKWKAYYKCYNDHPILRSVLDLCRKEFIEVDRCFKKERQEKARKNHRLASKNIRENIKKFALKDNSIE